MRIITTKSTQTFIGNIERRNAGIQERRNVGAVTQLGTYISRMLIY